MEQLRLAGCILPDSKGKVLLLHRIKRDHWEIPGGKIDEIEDGRLVSTGRTPEETVEKEMGEELTVEVDIIRKLGEREFDDNGYICHFTWYLGRVKAGSKPRIGEPHVFDDLKAFSRAELVAMRGKLSSNTRNFLDVWVEGELNLLQ
jgi:8-oxo-dGTP pyrophosphatase MutT (NUDIX family)